MSAVLVEACVVLVEPLEEILARVVQRNVYQLQLVLAAQVQKRVHPYATGRGEDARRAGNPGWQRGARSAANK